MSAAIKEGRNNTEQRGWANQTEDTAQHNVAHLASYLSSLLAQCVCSHKHCDCRLGPPPGLLQASLWNNYAHAKGKRHGRRQSFFPFTFRAAVACMRIILTLLRAVQLHTYCTSYVQYVNSRETKRRKHQNSYPFLCKGPN